MHARETHRGDGPDNPQAPVLTPEEDAEQRGVDPDKAIGADPPPTTYPDPDPGWQPDPSKAKKWRAIAGEIGREHRPRREDVYPYLLIRSVAHGDRGQRPLWPPTVCWESPDILFMDTDDAGPFDPTRLVVSPMAGRSYRMFVRIWNLGLFPAAGVLVRGWAVDPGFIGAGDPASTYFRDHEVGAAWSDLTDRRQGGCTTLVELDRPWKVEAEDVGHRCVIAQVTCPMDQSDGPLLVNADRHVAQRNLTVLSGPMPITALLAHLGGLVPERFTLEVTHAGPQALGVLQAIGGGTLPGPKGEPMDVRVPELDEVRVGLVAGRSVHLLTAFTQDGRTVVARSDQLAELAGVKDRGRGLHPFEQAGGTRRLLEQLGEDTWKRAGWLSDSALDEAVVTGLSRMLDLDQLDAGSVAQRLGGEGVQNALRFTLSDPEGQLVGGYTVVVS